MGMSETQILSAILDNLQGLGQRSLTVKNLSDAKTALSDVLADARADHIPSDVEGQAEGALALVVAALEKHQQEPTYDALRAKCAQQEIEIQALGVTNSTLTQMVDRHGKEIARWHEACVTLDSDFRTARHRATSLISDVTAVVVHALFERSEPPMPVVMSSPEK